MSLETGLILIGITAGVLLVWYLYRRSQNKTSEDTEPQPDEADDGYEDLLLTGLMLREIYDDDNDSSDDTDSDGYDDGFDGGYDDGGTLE